MPITPIESNALTSGVRQATAPPSPFNGDAFMKLLLVQLRHQDPLNPMKDQEFMAQLAQMNTLSELQKLNANIETMGRNLSLAQGASLIGRQVQTVSTGGTTVGVVRAVLMQGGEVMLDLGDSVVRLAEVQMVREGQHV